MPYKITQLRPENGGINSGPLIFNIMLIPVRCFTCGKVIGNKWERFLKLIEEEVPMGYNCYV
jgi:RNA polymerases N / 8 kDa subunit